MSDDGNTMAGWWEKAAALLDEALEALLRQHRSVEIRGLPSEVVVEPDEDPIPQ